MQQLQFHRGFYLNRLPPNTNCCRICFAPTWERIDLARGVVRTVDGIFGIIQMFRNSAGDVPLGKSIKFARYLLQKIGDTLFWIDDEDKTRSRSEPIMVLVKLPDILGRNLAHGIGKSADICTKWILAAQEPLVQFKKVSFRGLVPLVFIVDRTSFHQCEFLCSVGA